MRRKRRAAEAGNWEIPAEPRHGGPARREGMAFGRKGDAELALTMWVRRYHRERELPAGPGVPP